MSACCAPCRSSSTKAWRVPSWWAVPPCCCRASKFGLRLRLGEDVEVTNPEYDERFHQYWTTYWELMCRRGITKRWRAWKCVAA